MFVKSQSHAGGTMLERFIDHIASTPLFKKDEGVLLAVSGGKDSMAMLDLFIKAKYRVSVAHCNFNLRGAASDADEQLVKSVCEKHRIPFFQNSFDTQKYAQEKGISIQMAARALRYDWFQELLLKHPYSVVATAHHQNDVAETVLMNLTKGTGLAGLHGIYEKKGNIIRPLLNFSRKEIDDYVQEHDIAYREDQSNADTKYIRNKIRHKIIPELETINPSMVDAIINLTRHVRAAENVLQKSVNQAWEKCVSQSGDFITIDIASLQQLEETEMYLYYFLQPYGFNQSDVQDIHRSFNKASGLTFKSKTHQLLKDREVLVLSPLIAKDNSEFIIHSMDEFHDLPFTLQAEVVESKKVTITHHANEAFLDVDSIKFPVTLRKWKSGDRFFPFGMKGSKKLSDFFIDQKLTLFEKENTWIMLSNHAIFWVVGHRIDDRYKIKKNTQNILVLRKKDDGSH